MKRSQNLENLKLTEENLVNKILLLQIQLKGVRKSISKLEADVTTQSSVATEADE